MLEDGIVATRIADCIVIAIPDDLGDGRMHQVEQAVQRCAGVAMLRSVVFDMSALKYADATEFRALQAQAESLAILGVQPLMVGLNPGIIMHLVEVDAAQGRMRAFLDLADALQFLGLTVDGAKA